MELDQEAICEYCQELIIQGPAMTAHSMCEGNFCKDAREAYIDSMETPE